MRRSVFAKGSATTRRPLTGRRSTRLALLAGLLAAGLWAVCGAAGEAVPQVLLLEVAGPIGPAVSDYVRRGIDRAEGEPAQLVILRIDTPGGLDGAMRDIVRRILAARVPVVSFVAPGGARAASAGTYILYASHVAVMAPATNLGAATPVRISPGMFSDKDPFKAGQKGAQEDADEQPADAMERKLVNDAAAFIRGLAKRHGRNQEWAERAVREGASLTAEEALELGVIDLVAGDVPTLLEALEGREVTLAGGARTLRLAGARVVPLAPDWRSRLLAVITNPNVAYILMLVGIYGLFFELANPGNVLPGVAGAIALLLALYAFQVLPVNYAGLGLIVLGITFMVAEAFVPSFGALGVGGVVAFVAGSLILMETDMEGYTLSVPLVLSLAVLSVAFFLLVIGLAVRLRSRPVVSGAEEMVGILGEVMDDFDARGRIHVHGENWEAVSARPLRRGQKVRVRAVDGLTLVVEPETEED